MATLETIEALINLKFNQNEKEHKEVNTHLKKLNSQTEKNTNFRNKFSGGMTVIKAIGIMNILGMVAFWFTIIKK